MAAVTVAERDEVPTAQVLAWGFLLAYVLLISVGRSLYAAYGAAPSAPFEVLAFVGFTVFIWNWVTREGEQCGAAFPMDFAWFLSILWFVLVPYYMWRLQGWKGLLKCLIVFAWYLGTWAIGLAVFYGVAGS